MNYVLSFCRITSSSKIFSRNFYLPLLKPLTPKDALRTFRITGKWLLGSKIQHYMPVLLNHKQKRSPRARGYGQVPHKRSKDYRYMVPVLDLDNVDNHKLLLEITRSDGAKEAGFVYTVEDKLYNLVMLGPWELAIRDGEIIDVLMSQGSDKILVKLKNFKKVPVQIVLYEGKERLYKGEGATSEKDERFHHHGQLTMKIVKLFEDLERKEEEWETEMKRLMAKRKRLPCEDSKEWRDMVAAATANLDWKKFETDAKRLVECIAAPIIETFIAMEVEDFDKTKDVQEVLLKNGKSVLGLLPTLQDIPELINHLDAAQIREFEIEDDGVRHRICGAKVDLPSGRECFVTGQMVKTLDGDVFVPGQTVESDEFGVEYAPGITINEDDRPVLVNGLIVGDEGNQNPIFVPIECSITAEGHLSFSTTKEERIQFKPRRAPKKKVRKIALQNGEIAEEEYTVYGDDEGDFRRKKVKRRTKTVLDSGEIVYGEPEYVYLKDGEEETFEEGYEYDDRVIEETVRVRKKVKRRPKIQLDDGGFRLGEPEYVYLQDELEFEDGYEYEPEVVEETFKVRRKIKRWRKGETQAQAEYVYLDGDDPEIEHEEGFEYGDDVIEEEVPLVKRKKLKRRKRLVLEDGTVELGEVEYVYIAEGEEARMEEGFEYDPEVIEEFVEPEDERDEEVLAADDVEQPAADEPEEYVDPRIAAFQEQIEYERDQFKAMDKKIEELIDNIEVKKEEVMDKLEQLRNLTAVPEIDPVSEAAIEDALDASSRVTGDDRQVATLAEILLTMVRKGVAVTDKNRIRVENISGQEAVVDTSARARRCEKLKIALKTAMVAANGVFKNRPQDEVSALKAIGTVLELALKDKPELLHELCDNVMETAADRNEICTLLLEELSAKRTLNKITALKNAIDETGRRGDDLGDRLNDVLDKEFNLMSQPFRRLAKTNPEFLDRIMDEVRTEFRHVKTEECATEVLENAIVSAVKALSGRLLDDFLRNRPHPEDLAELLDQAVGLSKVLNAPVAATESLSELLRSKAPVSPPSLDPHSLGLLKRTMVIRKLADTDNGLDAALWELRKKPTFAKSNPRVRQIVRESATLFSSNGPIRTSKEIPAKYLDEPNSLALEDFVILRSRIGRPLLVSRNGKQAVVPMEVTSAVLGNRIPYTLVDEEGCTPMKAMARLATAKDQELGSKKGTSDKWSEGRFDVRNRARRRSNFSQRMVA